MISDGNLNATIILYGFYCIFKWEKTTYYVKPEPDLTRGSAGGRCVGSIIATGILAFGSLWLNQL